MLGIGMGEMVLIGAIALVVIGPDKFPDFAKIVMRTIRDLRGYVDEIQGEVSKELKPLKKEIDKISRDSEKYIDALSKETTVSTPAKPALSPTRSDADPTDRQDDSFEYTPNTGYEHHAADPYAAPETAETPRETGGEQAQTENAQERADPGSPSPDSGAGDNREDFDLSEPPVERLD